MSVGKLAIHLCGVNPCGASDAKVEWVHVGEGSETADAGARVHVEEPCCGGAPANTRNLLQHSEPWPLRLSPRRFITYVHSL